MAYSKLRLADTHPNVASQWHPVKNDQLTPQQVSASHLQKVWWLGPCGHEWQTTPKARTNTGTGCPYCAGNRLTDDRSLASRFPELVAEWSNRNDVPPTEVSFSSHLKVWWLCSKCGYEWQAPPNRRTGMYKSGCGRCAGNQRKSLSSEAPALAAEYSEKNTRSIDSVPVGTHEHFLWKCTQGHEWKATVNNRYFNDSGCPYCSGRLASPERNLQVLFPVVAAEWHPVKNGELRPDQVTPHSEIKAWWLGTCGHEFEQVVNARTTQGQGCPRCRSVLHTKLEQTFEELLGAPRFDQVIVPGRQYRPDLRLSETVFADAHGLFPHSEGRQLDRDVHRQRRLAFEAHGYRLLQFWSDEIWDRPAIVKSMVDAILGRTTMRLNARDTQVCVLTPAEAQEFLAANHLMGAVGQARHLGLRESQRLVAVLSYKVFADHIDIVRSAALLNTVVRGSFGKLLAAVRQSQQGLPIRTIVDLRYADGHSLERTGFVRRKETLQYQYTNGLRREDKRTFRVEAGINEVEAAASRGWYRLWDAGRATYELPST